MKKVLAILLLVLTVCSLAACKSTQTLDLGNTDRADVFGKNYDNLSSEYGKGEYKVDPELGGVLSGVAVMRLLDFTGDGTPELYVAYSDGTTPYANKQQIYGFSNGSAVIFSEFYTDSLEFADITSKSSEDAKAPCVWLYTDKSGLSYIVVGEDLSKEAEYYYLKAKKLENGDREIMELAFTEVDGHELSGTYEKIELAGVTEAEAERIFKENKKALDSVEKQGSK